MFFSLVPLTALVALLAAFDSTCATHQDFCTRMCPRTEAQCPSPCPPCPVPQCSPPQCPSLPAIPACPIPQCPSLPEIPKIDIPQCPSLPEIPSCSPPPVNVVCPEPICPTLSSPSCPECPKCPLYSVSLPLGYRVLRGIGSYKLYKEKVNWHRAKEVCALESAHLAIVNSQGKKNRLVEMMYNNAIKYIHLGIHNIDNEGIFITVIGQPLTYEHAAFWGSNPSNILDRNCTFMNRSGKMFQQSCNDNEAFVCEIPD